LLLDFIIHTTHDDLLPSIETPNYIYCNSKTIMMHTSIRCFLLLTIAAIVRSQETSPSIVPSNVPSTAPVPVLIDNNVPSTTPSVAPSSTLLEGTDTSNKPSIDAPSVAPSSVLLEETDKSNQPSRTPINVVPIPPVPPTPTTNKAPIFVATPTSPQSELCELNEECAALGLTGQCCPTIDKQYLYCCNGMIEQTCQKNPKCDALGLLGACCPTDGNIPAELDGIYLDCCETVPNECGVEKQSKRVGNDNTNTTISNDNTNTTISTDTTNTTISTDNGSSTDNTNTTISTDNTNTTISTDNTNTTTTNATNGIDNINTTIANTTIEATEAPSKCPRLSAAEFQERLAEFQGTSSSLADDFVMTTMLLIVSLMVMSMTTGFVM
jgi:hypothetical protein